MLDLKTVMIILAANATLQGAAWLFVWSTQRHLFELNFIAAGFIGFALGLLLVMLRGPTPTAWHITLDNTVINASIVLLADGIARFLNQPRYPLIGIGCVLFTIIFWPLALTFDPGNVAIRIHASSAITVIVGSMVCVTVLRDRTMPRLLRLATFLIMLGHVAASLLRMLLLLRSGTAPELPSANSQAWYFFEINVFTSALFLSLLLMVGIRLSSDLRQRNEDLQSEIAQRRILQDQLTAALEVEKSLRQEQKQLLRMVTHEFRTPLAVVDRAAEMIDVVLDKPPETVSRRLSSIRDAVHRLVQLIDRFLDVERRDLNILQPERVDIGTLLDRVSRHFAGLDLDTRLHFTAEPNLSFYWGDPEMLTTVLINLIDNALKYSPDGSPVEIAARTEDNAIVIIVTDRGIGIPEAEATLIGRRFFRASNTTPATGTGIGLYNTRRLLEYHNGILSLRAGPGGGTVATIRLPLPGVVPDVSMEVA